MAKVLIKDQKEIDVDYVSDGTLTIDGSPFSFDMVETRPNHFHIIKDHKTYDVEVLLVDKKTKNVSLLINGKKADLLVKDKMDLLLEKLGIANATAKKANDLKAPMPGLIFEINVEEGQAVQQGEPLLILEAMKMENVLKSPGDGVVKAILVKKSQSVEKNQVLIVFS